MAEQVIVDVQTGQIRTETMTAEQIASNQAVGIEFEAHKKPKSKLYKADIWRRATDAEATTIDAMLSAQPVKLRRLWADASFLSTTDELFTLIQAAATQAFGATRAAQLLEPTE